MAIQLSTALRNSVLSEESLQATLQGGLLYLFGGTPPVSVDDAASGNTLLCTISAAGGGTGLNFDPATGGVLSKAAAQAWQGVVIPAGGNVTFYRFVEGLNAADASSAAGTTIKRVQGTVGTAGADLNLQNVALVGNSTQDVDYFHFNLPASR